MHVLVSMEALEASLRGLWSLVSASGLENCSLGNILSTNKVNYCRESGGCRIVWWEVKKLPDTLSFQVIHLAPLSTEDIFHHTQDA